MIQKEYVAPHYVYDEIYNSLSDLSREFIHKYLFDELFSLEPQLTTYVDHIVIKHFMDESKRVLDVSVTHHKFYRRVQTSKKNWWKQVMNEVKEGQSAIHDEWAVLNRYFNAKLHSEKEKKLESLEIYIANQLEAIEEWAKNPTTLLVDFPYIKQTKKTFQIKKAMENDLILIIARVLKDIPTKLISSRANILVNNPVFSDELISYPKSNSASSSSAPNQLALDLTDTEPKTTIPRTQRLTDEYSYESYEYDQFIRSILEIDETDSLHLRKHFTLDSTDSQILDFISNQRDDELFYKDGIVIVDMSVLANHIYRNRGEKQYRLLETRLHKMAFSRVEGYSIGENKRTSFTINFFDSVKVTREHARVTAQIRFSKSLHEQMINNQTIGIYSHYLQKLENKVSKLLVYNLQKERLDAYLGDRDTKEYFDYYFFVSRIRFRVRTIESTLKQVKLALDEFLQHNILIDSYERYGAGFYIKLKPLTNAEKGDYFSQSSPSLFKTN